MRLVIAGIVAIAIGVLLIVKRDASASFAADSARQNARASSLLSQQRTERDLVEPYTSPEGRRSSSRYAALFGVFVCAAGVYLIVLGL